MNTCATCRFYDGPTEQCRRMCPVGSTIAQERLEQKAPWVAVWPIVQKTDWCGDHATGEAA